MEKVCNEQDSDSAVVFEVVGEPAIVINGVPNVASGGGASIHLDSLCDVELKDDPGFGEWLEGRKVRKMFGDQLYSGMVVKYDRETKWYRVIYEDGDFEDLEWHELEEVMLPLDISVPLTTLALQRWKCEKSVCELRIPKRKGYTKSVGSMEQTLELLQLPKERESQGKQLVETNFNSERTWQKTSQEQKETQAESMKPALQMFGCDGSVTKMEENAAESKDLHKGESMPKTLELFQRSLTTAIKGDELLQASTNREATVQKTLNRQKEIQKQSWKTARAEKQKRREKTSVLSSVSFSE